MPKVDADPADLRRLAQQLKRFKSDVESRLNGLNGNMSSMSSADPQQRRFAAEWDKSARAMRSFLNSIDSHTTYLERKAKQLEDYLR